jgi:cytochrome c biogenesis protein CcmG, thiol:disulfide interchange protein DsbE
MKKILFIMAMLLVASQLFAQQESVQSDIPVVNIRTLEGQQFSTADIVNDGKPVILSFWAIWCKPCQKELDAFNEHYLDWHEETGVKIYAVSIDDSRSTARVAPFVNGRNWEFEVLLDPNSDFKRAMNVNMIPHTFILDGNGKIVAQHTSYYEGSEFEIYEKVKKIAGIE